MRTSLAVATMTAALAALAPFAHAGNAAIVIPPVEIDTGVGTPLGRAPATTGPTTELLIGLHWASLAWRPTRFELGFGYIGTWRGLEPGYAPRSLSGTAQIDRELSLQGGYLELGKTLPGSSRHFRSWVAARGELLHGTVGDRDITTSGAALRLQSEVYVSGKAVAPNVGYVGTLALGVYVEASHRDIAAELGPDEVTSGVTVRLPFFLAGG